MSEPINCSDSELCIYLQALGGGFLATYYSDTSPSVQSKSIAIASKSWQHGKKTGVFPSFPSLQMSRNLMDDHGKDLSMLLQVGSPVPICQWQEKERELTDHKADSGKNKSGSFARYDQDLCLWKIAQHSLFEDLELSLQTWPRWGSMLNGECFHAQMSAEFTYESASGFSVPTTGANEGKGSSKNRYLGSPDFHGAKMSEGLRTCETDPIYLNPLFAELVMMWPLGWTDLKPLATDKFQDWYHSHSGF